MSERIKELLPNPFAVDYQAENGPLDLYTEKEMLNFAESIVDECIRVAIQAENMDERYAWFAIQQHFGVQE